MGVALEGTHSTGFSLLSRAFAHLRSIRESTQPFLRRDYRLSNQVLFFGMTPSREVSPCSQCAQCLSAQRLASYRKDSEWHSSWVEFWLVSCDSPPLGSTYVLPFRSLQFFTVF